MATKALAQQVEIFGSARISLHSLWRVVGSPPDHDPSTWLGLAGPLIDGYHAYRANLGKPDTDVPSGRILWSWEGESKDPWHQGDLMCERFLAIAYAIYLDEEGVTSDDSKALLD
jgi:hypothetical protein